MGNIYIWAVDLYRRKDALLPEYTDLQHSHFSVYLGQNLEIVAEARDNQFDTIEFSGISKIDVNTEDRLRASIRMLLSQVYASSLRPHTLVAEGRIH